MADMDKKLTKQVSPENTGRRDVQFEIDKMCKCLEEHYDAAILLASKDENTNKTLHQESEKLMDNKWYKKAPKPIGLSACF